MAVPKSFIPDNQNLPKSFIPDPPKKTNKVLDVASRVLDIPSSLAGGAMKASREAVTGEYKAPELKVGGLDLGKLIHPVAVGAVRGLKEHSTVMEELPKTAGVDPDSLAGIALGLAGEIATPDPLDLLKLGKGVKKGVEKVITKGGKVIEEGGESLIVRGLKASPSQQKKFAEKTGQKLSEFMSKNGITSDFVEKSAQKLDELQNSFDEIALRSDIKIGSNDLLSRFGKKVMEYTDSVIPEMKGKAESIKKVGENLAAKYGDEISIADLTKERRGVDKLLKEGSFNLPVEQANYLRTVRDVLQETVQDYTSEVKVAGKGLKQIGIDLRNMFTFDKIAKQQAGLGKGTNLLGLGDLLAAGVGLPGGLPGSLGMVALKKSLQSPKVLEKGSGALGAIGRFGQRNADKISSTAGSVFDSLKRIGRTQIRQPNRD